MSRRARKLVWADEFDYSGPPDPSKWTCEEGFLRNRELHLYTPSERKNVWVENGMLIIEARKERVKNPAYDQGDTDDWKKSRKYAEYTSASITTRGKACWRYGRVEVRAKIPSGKGMWPAIWMLGANRNECGWPDCGEIDIMENVGHEPDLIYGTVHTRAYNHVLGTQKGERIQVPAPYEDFHVYAVDWNSERIDFLVDQAKYFSFANEGMGTDAWPFDGEHYLILNIAVGGSWGGAEGIDNAIFPQRFCIDYVRVYT